MSKVTYHVGLDYHQHSVQVCVMDSKGNIIQNATRPNDWQSVVEVVPEGGTVFAAIEACCGAADFAEELIHKAGWSVNLAHPGYVARIKQSPDKTDWADAKLLADLERVGYLPKVWLAPENIRELRRLVRYRQQQVNQRRNVKLRIRALLRDQRAKAPSGINPWTKAWRAWAEGSEELGETSRWILSEHFSEIEMLSQKIRTVEKRLTKMLTDDPVAQKLLEQSGVGLVTAATLRAEIGRFDRFRSGKQLARFCAVTPRNASSGQRQADAGLIKAGNRELRRVLVEAAQRLRRLDDYWVDFADRMKERGKPSNVITAAVANRWIRGLYYEMCHLAA
ncbi:MAG: IS110 family transposase [Rhodopirellula sp. JB044]|uniref:IS110 family transposase n=1 Tax=Rhodopirellula sp. JB044 TaxID=3342844 RepID=UPI00370AE2D2